MYPQNISGLLGVMYMPEKRFFPLYAHALPLFLIAVLQNRCQERPECLRSLDRLSSSRNDWIRGIHGSRLRFDIDVRNDAHPIDNYQLIEFTVDFNLSSCRCSIAPESLRLFEIFLRH
jgi:hypothetical protein